MKKTTVQLYYFDIYNNPKRVIRDGYACDVGLPEPHCAVVHKEGVLWKVTHLQSGTSLCGTQRTRQMAIDRAKYNLSGASKKEVVELCDKRAHEFEEYKQKLPPVMEVDA
jgi:hypothetical protein